MPLVGVLVSGNESSLSGISSAVGCPMPNIPTRLRNRYACLHSTHTFYVRQQAEDDCMVYLVT